MALLNSINLLLYSEKDVKAFIHANKNAIKRKEVNAFLDKANKRIQRLQNAKLGGDTLHSNALNRLYRDGAFYGNFNSGKITERTTFSIKGLDIEKDLDKIQMILAKAKDFLENETSTVSGAKKKMKETADKFRLTDIQANHLINVYNNKVELGEISMDKQNYHKFLYKLTADVYDERSLKKISETEYEKILKDLHNYSDNNLSLFNNYITGSDFFDSVY